jgi:hypothetical protein
MIILVVASSRQKFDLVSKDYYKDEIAYQNVLDAGHNQSALSTPIGIHANGASVILEFPSDFKGRTLTGDVLFYSPVNEDWDRDVKISADDNTMTIPRSKLNNTRYTIKINCVVDGKAYYQESDIQLDRQ